MKLNEIMERCRELHIPWLAARGKDVQLSLLTTDEIVATVEEVYWATEQEIQEARSKEIDREWEEWVQCQ